jgi:hypothetical protein
MSYDEEEKEPEGITEEGVELDDDAFDEEDGVPDEGEGSIYGEEDDMEEDFLSEEDDRDSNY